MLYSAASQSIEWWKLIFFIPHAVVGVGLLTLGYKEKCVFKNMSGWTCIAINYIFGFAFVVAGFGGVYSGLAMAHSCRTAVRNGEFTTESGVINIASRSTRTSNGYVEFTIGDHYFRTEEMGFGSECGFISPLGHVAWIKNGMVVSAKAHNGAIVEMSRE